MPTVCPHCGARSPETATYCAGCGRDRDPAAATAPTPTPTPTPTMADVPQHQDASSPPEARTLAGAPPPPGYVPNGAPGVPFQPAPPAGRADRARLWITLAVVLVLVGGGVTTGVLLKRGDDGHGRADKQVAQQDDAGTASPSPSRTPAPSVAATPSPAQTPAEQPATGGTTDGGVPDGFHRVHDQEGFAIGVMDGWQRRKPSATQVDYVAPTGPEYLRVGIIAGAAKSSYDNFLELEQKARSREDYRRTRLVHNTFQGQPAAQWEFTYTSDAGETIRAMDQAYVSADGTEYAIYFEARDRLWNSETDTVFATALNTWGEPHAS